MVTRSFGAEQASVGEARRFVLSSLGAAPPETRDKVELMVSELATNALVYGRTEFRVGVEVRGNVVRVEVTDQGAGTPKAAPAPPALQPHGRGLLIVGGLADAWGVVERPGGRGKTVWFSLTFPSGPNGAKGGAQAGRDGGASRTRTSQDGEQATGTQAARRPTRTPRDAPSSRAPQASVGWRPSAVHERVRRSAARHPGPARCEGARHRAPGGARSRAPA
jgi:anti-sigma regulatory factor (Ser/Thr protein kinase)